MKILLSIKPKHVEKIVKKEKKYEYRKTNFSKKNITKAIIYSTSPVSKIVGEFNILKIHQDTPSNIWEKTKDHSGVSQKEFEQYFDGKNKAIAIQIGDIYLYEVPKKIDSIDKNMSPPQSFCYVE